MAAHGFTLAERLLAICSSDTALSAGAGLIGGLALVGLVGGAIHCSPMCGPFALAQATARPGDTAGRLGRFMHAVALPYHLGRLTTYAALGALSGAFGGAVIALSGFREIAAGLLIVAALILAAQAMRAFGHPLPLPAVFRTLSTRASQPVMRRMAPLARRLASQPAWLRGYGMGVLLGFLPCGLLYGALFAAASSGTLIAGALVMAAFAAGTAPALGVIAASGHIAQRRWPTALRRLSGATLALGAGISIAFAIDWMS